MGQSITRPRNGRTRGWRGVRGLRSAPLIAILPLAGCSSPGAPSLILAGAYFPAWILCSVIGILAAIVARIVMVGSGLSNTIPLQLFVCVALGLLVAVATWIFWFGQ